MKSYLTLGHTEIVRLIQNKRKIFQALDQKIQKRGLS